MEKKFNLYDLVVHKTNKNIIWSIVNIEDDIYECTRYSKEGATTADFYEFEIELIEGGNSEIKCFKAGDLVTHKEIKDIVWLVCDEDPFPNCVYYDNLGEPIEELFNARLLKLYQPETDN